jgi:hypothetical protein
MHFSEHFPVVKRRIFVIYFNFARTFQAFFFLVWNINEGCLRRTTFQIFDYLQPTVLFLKVNIETLPQVSSSNPHQLMYFLHSLPNYFMWCHLGNQFPQIAPVGMKMSPFPLISISQQVQTDWKKTAPSLHVIVLILHLPADMQDSCVIHNWMWCTFEAGMTEASFFHLSSIQITKH